MREYVPNSSVKQLHRDNDKHNAAVDKEKKRQYAIEMYAHFGSCKTAFSIDGNKFDL